MKQNNFLFKIISALIIGIVFVFSFWAGSAKAETTVAVEGCKIKVTVNIAIYGDGADQAYADKVKAAAEKIWNDAHIKAGECKCELDLTVNVAVVKDCSDPAAKNRHCLKVNKVPAGTFHRSAVSGVAGNMKPNGASNDPAAPHVASGTGDLGSNDSDKVIAHEVGHLMGLKDEYEDYYQYYYAKADGSIASGPFWIKKADFTDAKKTELENNAPPGTTLKFAGNPSNNNDPIWSRPMAGKENSLMAGIGPNAAPQDSNAEDLLGDAKLSCPDECCCGDGKVQKNKKEECDPKANPNGCPNADEDCAKNCKCVKITPRCGDTKVSPPEECDPTANPVGCRDDQECISCKCEDKKPPLPVPAVPSSTPAPVVTTTPPEEPDSDNDGVDDADDNCPNAANSSQSDKDNDGVGDACDSCTDEDKDGRSVEGGECGAADCNDHNSAIFPGASDVCGDGLDNNCDGIDEQCAPSPVLDVLPPQVSLGPSLTSMPINVVNIGEGTLSWHIIPNLPIWLKVNPPSGTIEGQGAMPVMVSIQEEYVEPGQSYSHIISISSNGGTKQIIVNATY